MDDPLQSLDVECLRCQRLHRASAFARGLQAEWIVECGALRVSLLTHRPTHGSIPLERLPAISRALEARLAEASLPQAASPTAIGERHVVTASISDRLALSRPAPWLLVSSTDGRCPPRTFPRGLLAIVLALDLPGGAEVTMDANAWVFRLVDGREIRVPEPFDDPAHLQLALDAVRNKG